MQAAMGAPPTVDEAGGGLGTAACRLTVGSRPPLATSRSLLFIQSVSHKGDLESPWNPALSSDCLHSISLFKPYSLPRHWVE